MFDMYAPGPGLARTERALWWLREFNGLSVEEVSIRTGIAAHRLARYECGEDALAIGDVLKVAVVLHSATHVRCVKLRAAHRELERLRRADNERARRNRERQRELGQVAL